MYQLVYVGAKALAIYTSIVKSIFPDILARLTAYGSEKQLMCQLIS